MEAATQLQFTYKPGQAKVWLFWGQYSKTKNLKKSSETWIQDDLRTIPLFTPLLTSSAGTSWLLPGFLSNLQPSRWRLPRTPFPERREGSQVGQRQLGHWGHLSLPARSKIPTQVGQKGVAEPAADKNIAKRRKHVALPRRLNKRQRSVWRWLCFYRIKHGILSNRLDLKQGAWRPRIQKFR